MKFRFDTSAAFFVSALLAIPLPSQTPDPRKDSARNWTATIQALVRDDRGNPIAGLGADDFILTEHGERDKVVEVFSLAGPDFNGSQAPIESFNPQPVAPTQVTQGPHAATWVLVVLAPMSASGRGFAIAGLLKFLNQSGADKWHVALFDDEGNFVPFGQDLGALRSRISATAKHVSAPQFQGGSWVLQASRAIEDLAIRPGRHAIVFASDFESSVSDPIARNPDLLRIGPSAFIGAAVYAQAAMYTVQGSAPGVVVPFGGAAESQYSGSGEQVAEIINRQTVGLGELRGDFLYAAEQTGGHVASDMQDAFADIASDGTGYYQIAFQAKPIELDGGWHPVSISVRAPNAHIRGPGYYLAPVAESRRQIPISIAEALKQGTSTTRLDAAAHVWLFPDAQGVHTGVMAADLSWPTKNEGAAQSSRIQIFAQLFDDSMGRVVGSWLSERDWKMTAGQYQPAHWQREATLYPGSYTLRVIAMDSTSRKIGTREYSFLVNRSNGAAIRFGAVVIADRCLDEEEREGRSNLLDPLLVDGCLWAPSASAGFSLNQKPTVLVRIYPPTEKVGALILKQWKAYAVVDSGPPANLAITSADIRGLVASAPLTLSNLNLKPGTHLIRVFFEAHAAGGHEYPMTLKSQLTVSP
jgi:VWFA-related protein